MVDSSWHNTIRDLTFNPHQKIRKYFNFVVYDQGGKVEKVGTKILTQNQSTLNIGLPSINNFAIGNNTTF